ncbi:MAG: DUF4294 domain-containing protein [Prevotellaceae bacterium]|jgi:hypothetical protein|nr:DUF4294 domain-containing protein [Prevotellaceae bacterium]
MKTPFKPIIALLLFFIFIPKIEAQQQEVIYSSNDGWLHYQVLVSPEGDTIYQGNLRTMYVFPEMKFKSASQEKFYWKTVRDVKKTLPLARIVSRTLNQANSDLEKIPDKKERKKYLKNLEKEVKQKYEQQVRDLTFGQGKILIKLIDRETNMTSYELIKLYRGPIAAAFWQGIARLFGANLKDEYDGTDKDKIVERVIILVENGQL